MHMCWLLRLGVGSLHGIDPHHVRGLVTGRLFAEPVSPLVGRPQTCRISSGPVPGKETAAAAALVEIWARIAGVAARYGGPVMG